MKTLHGSIGSAGHLAVLVLISFSVAPTVARADAATACAALASASLALPSDATSLSIDSTVLVPAGTAGLPEYCQVAGRLDTEINFLLLLPTAWNGKLLMSGNANTAGSFGSLLPSLSLGLARKYAVVGTDTGHNGPASVLLNRPDRIANFQYRAVHLVALAAKEAAAVYYSAPPAHAYFYSCSTGGRQASTQKTSTESLQVPPPCAMALSRSGPRERCSRRALRQDCSPPTKSTFWPV